MEISNFPVEEPPSQEILCAKLVTVSSNDNSSQKKKDSRILRRSAHPDQNVGKESKNQTTLENAPRIRNTIQCLKKIKKRMARKTGRSASKRSVFGNDNNLTVKKTNLKGSLGFRKASSSQRKKAKKKTAPAHRSGVGWRRKPAGYGQNLHFNLNRNHQLRGARRGSKQIFSHKRSQPVPVGVWEPKSKGKDSKTGGDRKGGRSWRKGKAGASKNRSSKSKTYSYSRAGSKANNRQKKTTTNPKYRSSQKILNRADKKTGGPHGSRKRSKARKSNLKMLWTAAESGDQFYRISKSPVKPSLLSRNDLETALATQNIRSFSRRRLMTSHPRQFSPSLRMRSLRRETEHILFSQNRDKETFNKPAQKGVNRFSRNFSIKDFRSQIDLKKNQSGALFRPEKNFQRVANRNLSQRKKLASVKGARSPTRETPVVSNLRRNFSNFQLGKKDGRKKRAFNEHGAISRVRTRGLLTQNTSTGLGISRSCSRQITWVPGARSGSQSKMRTSKHSKALKLPKSRLVSKRSVSKSKRDLNYGLSLFGDAPRAKMKSKSKARKKNPSRSKRRSKKSLKRDLLNVFPCPVANKYNSMHINSVPQEESYVIDPSQSKQSQSRKSGRKGASLLTEVVPKQNIKKLPSRKRLKSRPILKELVAQLKGNDSLQLEILKSLGCNLQNRVKASPERKSKNFKKRTISSRDKNRLERLRHLNCLINNDQQQVSRLKNQLQRSAFKAVKRDKTGFPTQKTCKRGSSKNITRSGQRKGSKSSQRKGKQPKFSSKQRSYINLKKGACSAVCRPEMVLNPLTGNSNSEQLSFHIEPKSLQNNNLISFPFNSKISQYSGSNAKQKSFSKRQAPERLYLLLDSSCKARNRNSKRHLAFKKHQRETSKSHKNLFPKNGKKENRGDGKFKKGSKTSKLKLQKTSPLKRPFLRDQDIQNHMNLILINGVYLDKKRAKKGGQSSVIYIPHKKFPRFG